MTTVLAAVTAALSAMLIASGRPDLLGERLGRSGSASSRPAVRSLPAVPARARIIVGGLGGMAVGGVLAGAGGALAGTLAVPGGLVWLARRRSRLARRRREGDVAEACLALAGELGSGAPARHALAAVARDWPDLFAGASGRAAVGGDPAVALRESGRQPGAEALAAVAAAWEVSERTGAALSTVLVAVADSLRAEAAVRREADAQLASVRATSRLMALLPVATLALFSAGDGGAVDFLTRTSYGVVCLVLAAVFIATGLFWVDRTARAVRSVWEP